MQSTPRARLPLEPAQLLDTETRPNHYVVLSLSMTAPINPADSTWHASGVMYERVKDAGTSHFHKDTAIVNGIEIMARDPLTQLAQRSLKSIKLWPATYFY